LRFLLTSAGIKNTSIHEALVDLLGKPIAESSALCIPTAIYAFPGGAGSAWRLLNGRAATPLCEVGWQSLGVLELTALPSIDERHWVPMVQETDALLVGGGDPCICATGYTSRDWRTSSRHCAKRSGWE
jgi:dipeptidase E